MRAKVRAEQAVQLAIIDQQKAVKKRKAADMEAKQVYAERDALVTGTGKYFRLSKSGHQVCSVMTAETTQAMVREQRMI